MHLEETRALALMVYVDAIRTSLQKYGLPPSLGDAIYDSERIDSARSFLWWAARSWEDGLVVLHRVLMEAIQLYCQENNLDGMPISFPLDIIEEHEEKWESSQVPVKLQQAIARRLKGECGITIFNEGEVREQDYERASQELEKLRVELLQCCEDEEVRKCIAEAWPFQDGKWSTTAELCV